MEQRGRMGVFVKIIATPPGMAPEEIRRAWIGLILPTMGWEGSDTAAVRKAFGSPSDTLNLGGYVVSGPKALEILKKRSEEAWAYWMTTIPRLCEEGVLIFKAEVCQEVPGGRR